MLYQSPMCRGQSLCGGAACAISGSSHARTQVTRHRASRTARAAATRLERHIRRLAVSLLIPHRCQKGLFFFDFSAASAA